MSHYSIACYPELPEAHRLASLAGIRDDLDQVLSYCTVVERQVAKLRRIPSVWDGMTSAAVVAYARCFTSGVRTSSSEALHSATPELLEAHEYFMNLRSKHVAHSVNAFEENRLTVELRMEDRTPQQVVGVDVAGRRVIGVGEHDLKRLRELTEWLLERISALYATEQTIVLDRVRKESLESLLETRGEPLPAFLKSHSITKRRAKP